MKIQFINNAIFKKYFKNAKIITKNGVIKFFKLYPEYQNILDQYLIENPNWESIQNIVTGIIKDIDLPFCNTCGKQLKYHHLLFNRRFCSIKCSSSNKDEIKKRQETCLRKYGVKNAFNNEKSRNSFKQTLKLKKKEIQQKKETTYLNNNNCKYHSLLKGYNNLLKCSAYITPLFSLTEYKGYNHLYKWKCSLCGNIFESTIHCSRHVTIKNFVSVPRCLKCFPIKSYFNTILSWKDYIIPLFDKSQYVDKHQHYSRIYMTNHIKEYPFLPRCTKCYPLINTGYSNIEEDFVNFCKLYFPNLRTNSKKLIYPHELDIIIDELKLAIEFNGIYWHSTKRKPLGYHLMKTEKCEAKGYRLIHIWEDEWNNSQNEIKNRLISIFQQNENIDCSVPLDRCWYSTLQFKKFKILKPELITKNRFQIENCGYLLIENN
jgi:very-short-patch-repair endonuclease